MMFQRSTSAISGKKKNKNRERTAVLILIMVIVTFAGMSFTLHVFATMAGGRSRVTTGAPGLAIETSTVSYYGENGAKSYSQFFQTIRSMTVEFNFSSSEEEGTSSCEKVSFSTTAEAMDDGNVGYKVDLVGMESSGNKTDTDAARVWIDPSTSNIIQVTMGGEKWLGSAAEQESAMLSFLTTDYWLSLLNSSTVQPTDSSQSYALGSTLLYATSYVGLPSFVQYPDLEITVGVLPQNGMQIVLFSHYAVPGAGIGTFKVLSLQLNNE